MNNGIWNKRVADLTIGEAAKRCFQHFTLSKLWLGSFQKVLLSTISVTDL